MKTTVSLFVALIIGSAVAITSGTAFAEAYLFDLLAKPTYNKSWNALFLGETNVDYWLAQYSKTKNGPAGPGKTVNLGDTQYQINNVCKTHDCGDNQFFVLFAPNGAKAWGFLLKNREPERFFGNPDDEKKKALRSAAYD